MKNIFLSVLFLLTVLVCTAQYNPSLHTVTNKSIGVAQAVPTDARSFYYDAGLAVYRPYQSTAEVLSYLNLSKYRTGNFPIFVNVGGTLASGVFTGGTIVQYTFKNGTTNGDLVLMEHYTTAEKNKLAAITGTNTGDQDLSGYVPTSRTITINGTTLDLAADRSWVIATEAGSVNWGAILGDMEDQPDLQSALDAKQNTITTGSTAQYFRGDFSLATFPTNLSSFSNGPGYLTPAAADALYAALVHTHSFASLTSKPTTLAGYGITDAYPLSGNPSGFKTTFGTLQQVTDNGNTTTADVEITDYTKGIILKTSDGTRARITLKKDGSGNLYLEISDPL